MKIIILAAWEGSRLRPLTYTKPKPLIKIVWKTIIEHNLEYIYKSVSEIIFIIKYKWEEIQKYFWDNYKWVKITYKTQWDKNWTWWALMWLDLDSDVIVLNWDSIFEKEDLEKIVNFNWYGVLVKPVKNPQKYWIFKIDNDWNIKEIIEKSNIYVWNLANLWIYKFNYKIFEYINQIDLSPRNEYELTDAINLYIKNYPLKALEITWNFVDISYPWDILSANTYFLNKLTKSEINWIVEEWVNIKWNIILEEWAILKAWTYIEWNVYIWKNSIIWPNTYLRKDTVIWNNCRIWNWVEVKESSIWDNSNAAHLSYIWNSIIWNNVNLWGWFMTANLRHDETNIKVPINWELIDTKLTKFWCIIWDNSKTWLNTSIYPWRVIWDSCYTVPWEIVK